MAATRVTEDDIAAMGWREVEAFARTASDDERLVFLKRLIEDDPACEDGHAGLGDGRLTAVLAKWLARIRG